VPVANRGLFHTTVAFMRAECAVTTHALQCLRALFGVMIAMRNDVCRKFMLRCLTAGLRQFLKQSKIQRTWFISILTTNVLLSTARKKRKRRLMDALSHGPGETEEVVESSTHVC